MKRSALDRAYRYFQRIDRRPPRWAESALLRGSSERRDRLEDRLKALRLPVDPLHGQTAPEIEVLLVAAAKDFSLLPLAARSALQHAGHPLSKVTFVVPERDLVGAEAIAATLDDISDLAVVSEDDVIPATTRSALRAAFADRYGWVLQQLLCVASVAESSAAGVLVLDADTVLLRPRVLLSGGRQVLMRSLEHHDPYFAFLETLDARFVGARGSHVTHHMLQQPEVMRAILAAVCGGDVESLARSVCAGSRGGSVSQVSIDYELYAQGLLALFPDRHVDTKWCNVVVNRDRLGSGELDRLAEHYCSVSLHDYV